ncbi:esterase/lipase family protein [Nocardia huaxiensis]|uniref:Alpha/beta fold hydrolase n=1 Tax=Nocardia huaxiensis TaxID=2755382 RepID=A0A7D6VBD4_9NOCA|nr:alpha/beta fold hydrolase [Nocardia huaxiensis]QLY30242.1 alpha/beta fold hydrolase [Nocardia huaxiensis]UFS96138.1 alpha/beta fold hydrolase [Nocardia huaxiensis]
MRRIIRRLPHTAAILAAAAFVTLGMNTGVAHADSGSHSSDTVGYGPEFRDEAAAVAYGLANPDVAPQGSNDWNCKPDAAHPRPVVLVHGTWASAFSAYSYMSPQLARAGYCVFTFNYGRANAPGAGLVQPTIGATGYIEDSARQLADFVDRVRAATGAAQVDLIGHSQGGVVAREYLKFDGGADPADPSDNKVANLITFGATNHGTTLAGLGNLLGPLSGLLGVNLTQPTEDLIGHAGIQQLVGSPVLTALNDGGDTVPGVHYTIVADQLDEVSTPAPQTFLTAGPGATVDNVTLQDGCGADTSDHNSMLFSPRAVSIALHALDPVAHPDLVCSTNPWLL